MALNFTQRSKIDQDTQHFKLDKEGLRVKVYQKSFSLGIDLRPSKLKSHD